MIILGVSFCGTRVPNPTETLLDLEMTTETAVKSVVANWRKAVPRCPSLEDCLGPEDAPDTKPGVLLVTGLASMKKSAEARLWAKRQARAEAREIRMRELERQQREQEENADRQFDMLAAASEPPAAALVRTPRSARYHNVSSRRSSEDSLEDAGGSLRELRHELKEVEEKFRKAMIANAQLDNDKAAQTYQLELLKDRLEELEEDQSQLKREHRDKCREHDQLKRLYTQLKDDLAAFKHELAERDRLIAEKGLVLVTCEDDGVAEGGDGEQGLPRKALVTADNAKFLETAGDGSLDVRLARFAKEKSELQDQISHLKLELEEERNRRRKSGGNSLLNGPSSDYDLDDVQREASKQLADYKFRAQKAEQDVATLQATVARLESQVIRYKTAAEVSEQSEEALKAEKRKLQREINTANGQILLKEASCVALRQQHERLLHRRSVGAL
ncbi:leucine-rich repeat flightless-interacting protein 2 isoform X2 [Cylas formicarius]|uniref:leucine-rich repeat flightless-interacting protein 2 isoform X2 n=1 Tax=Cylas formicarius TaxID=197179 RepID=UPI002958790E|nr:leucine-rich repeat flightless-interacting protein 2 isoform X2 [Cylas formicarius]